MEIFSFELILQQLLYGLLMGSIYVLMAVGFSLIWGIMDMLNFAHGEFFMLGAYFTYYLSQVMHVNPIISIFGAFILVGILGGLLFNFIIYPINKKPNWLVNTIIITLGVSICTQNLALIVFGERYKTLPKFIEYTVSILGINIGAQRLIIMIIALILLGGLWIFIQKTDIGISMQAVGQNNEAAQIVGLPIRAIYTSTFVVSGALAGAAGGLLAPIYSIYPSVGFMPMVMAFLVVILGGLGSIKGAVYAGFLLGIVESMAILYLSTAWKAVAVFALMIAVLSFRPTGLFGTRSE
jgi:branched-chain amino acid transport system permease protein